MLAHICTPLLESWKIRVLYCPTCKRRRRMLVEFFEWYGSTTSCLMCADEWNDGALAYRPAERGWRKKYRALLAERVRRLTHASTRQGQRARVK